MISGQVQIVSLDTRAQFNVIVDHAVRQRLFADKQTGRVVSDPIRSPQGSAVMVQFAAGAHPVPFLERELSEAGPIFP